MIAFATFFLGLIVGTQPVTMLVDGSVAAVDVLLDDVVVARVAGPPWRADVPFGGEPEPHELLAIAYDADGTEVARAHQWINLPRPPAEGRVLLDGGEGGRGVVARLIWESVASETPSAVRLVFDGRELAVDDPRRFVLPDHDPERLHYLRAELEFAGSIASVIETTFGGSFTGQADSRQMAVPIQIGGGKLESSDALQGRFAKDGEPIRVLAVDEGPAEVVLVRDKGAQPLFDRLARHERSRTPLRTSFRYTAGLKKNQRVRFLSPFARLDRRAGFNYELFLPSEELTPHDGGMFWHLLTVRPSPTAVEQQRLSDAVAVAGMIAASRNHRRAVVVLIADRPADASRLSPAGVRRYLRALRVPLFVWSLGELSQETLADWGEARDVSSLPRLERATGELGRFLNRQRIVWLEGIHLPQRLTVTAGLPAVELAD